MSEPPGVITVTAPADASSIAIFRLVAAGVTARTDASIDVVDDVRIAVAEACNYLLANGPEAGTLSMEVAIEPDRLRVVVAMEPAGQAVDMGLGGSDLSWTIIRGLTDLAESSTIDGRSRITMVVSTATIQR